MQPDSEEIWSDSVELENWVQSLDGDQRVFDVVGVAADVDEHADVVDLTTEILAWSLAGIGRKNFEEKKLRRKNQFLDGNIVKNFPCCANEKLMS